MGGLPSLRALRPEKSRAPHLPVCRNLRSPAYSKEQYSDAGRSSSDDSADDEYSTSSPPSSRSSRRHRATSRPLMFPRDSLASGGVLAPTMLSRRRRHLFRLPHKVMRWLCFAMIAMILVFMYSLVRASWLENQMIMGGKLKRLKAPPNEPLWSTFPFLTRYYGGVRTLGKFEESRLQYPKPEDDKTYNEPSDAPKAARREGSADLGSEIRKVPPSQPWKDFARSSLLDENAGSQVHECFLDSAGRVRVPSIRYYEGRPDGFPQNVIGSYELLGLPEDICFDRYGRFGPYGHGYSVKKGGLGIGMHGDQEDCEAVWADTGKVEWEDRDWAEIQRRCYQTNLDRFKPATVRDVPPRGFYNKGVLKEHNDKLELRSEGAESGNNTGKSAAGSQPSQETVARAGNLTRSAIVVRCWDEYHWKREDIMNLRALISELALASGGRYDIHLLVQVKNDAQNPVWADDEIYKRVIQDRIPLEFQGLATLWTETQMLALYQGIHDLFARGPGLPVHGSYRGLQMAMQYFAYNHPEYDYFWQWEMDIRYIGHYHDLLTKLEQWSQDQPRKGLWERNGRFYVPSVHGTWEDFKQMVRVQTELGTVGADNIWNQVLSAKTDPNKVRAGEQSVWGPARPADENDWFDPDEDPVPPTSHEKDHYQWGVGEPPDLITLNPMFDPDGTTWGLANDITGYNENVEGRKGKPPRRAQIITASRMSRRLLLLMHRETAFKKHHAFPEMWPATVALQHGLKAVAVPHPIYVDRAWPTGYMAQIFNGGRNGASGGARTSVFGDREHNMLGLTWFYNAGFSGNLYRRWMGMVVNNDGGPEFEVKRSEDPAKDGSDVPLMRGGEGRMCLPPMLMHPIKELELLEKEGGEADEVPDSDLAA